MNRVAEYDAVSQIAIGEVKRLNAEGVDIDLACISLIALVDSIENELLRRAGQVDIRVQRTDDPPAMDKLLTYEVSTELMVGNEPAIPSTGPYSAQNLRNRIQDFVERIANATNQSPLLYAAILNTADVPQGRYGVATNWEAAGFYHLPLICVLDRLIDIKIKVRYVELYALAYEDVTPFLRGKGENTEGEGEDH